MTAGATLVRDSDPAYEVAETLAKAGGILTAFGLADAPAAPVDGVEELTRDEDVLIALGSRNQRLSRFWLTDQGGAPPSPELKGRTAAILEGEDDFVNMLRHVLTVLGMTATVVPYDDYATGAFDGYDLVIVGPGPGDPRDGDAAEDRRRSVMRPRTCWRPASRSSASAWATRCCATGSGFPLPTRTSSSRAPSPGSRSGRSARRSSGSTTRSSGGPTRRCPRVSAWRRTPSPATST